MIEREGELPGRRLGRGDPLPFRCHAGLPCFNSCCRDKRLTLLPYDVVRLSRALGLASGAFLAAHGELEIDPASGWPTLRIRLSADGRCPFVRPEGCGVYEDRPTCCRIYPLARAVGLGAGGAPVEVLVVDATRDRCGGFDAPAAHTVDEWMRGQGLEAYRGPNERVARLLLDPRRPRPMSLSPEDVHAVVMALYNADVLREFVARPGFAARSGLDEERVAQALRADEDLLALGQDWLAARLFG
ncbi:MAG TPA: YkgJ family cysteine cluster protein [Anaeromyxobacter sp.]|nr:YkgJ family cysteine cluster protein [Anaeromyxobacter sp.]